ncbi:hypothetical protein B005_1929 [Nocardiopsis alba ATCC BAA-2165]|uniref:Uncharacterized protein n=1 Tax=Nocardiopsis alba (strain ATCC BAA-2165 / BE74) TaxID=1205910 RepID=J7L443_NOCAA|nr:hypothetical protein B005_1929 [Nocardiopsis alba ATCC BAA-2165]
MGRHEVSEGVYGDGRSGPRPPRSLRLMTPRSTATVGERTGRVFVPM